MLLLPLPSYLLLCGLTICSQLGMPLAGELFFMYTTILIAVPTGVKVFNWVATMWKGAMTFETPMLFALGFVILFTIGGFSGLMLGVTPVDFQYHDTYFVVAHFHYVLVTGAVYSLIAATYFWLPKWTGHMYNETLGKWHFWLSTISVNILFSPSIFGFAGMPRRIPDYSVQFAEFNMISSIGGWVYGLSQLLFVYIIIKCVRGGKKLAIESGMGLMVWNGLYPRQHLITVLILPPDPSTIEGRGSIKFSIRMGVLSDMTSSDRKKPST